MATTMASLLTKKLTFLNSLFPSCRHHNLTFLTPLFHFSTQIHQNESHPFMAQYLISSFGFSEERALRVSSENHFSPIKTRDRPDSVVHFFKDTGLTDMDIQSLISWNPRLLCCNVEKTLKPRASELMTAGFTGNTFIQLIKYNSSALTRKNTLSVLQFWRSFLNNNEKALLKVIKRNQELMNVDINTNIIPKMNLLREYDLSYERVAILVKGTSFISIKLDKIKLLLERTENLGFQRGSKLFVYGLIMVKSLSKDTIERKIKFFKNTYNWSDEEVNSAISKFPRVLWLSEDNVRSSMDFLVTKMGFDAKRMALQPSILTYSLKGRLIPRHYVINMLKSKGLQVNNSFQTVIAMKEEKFVEKFIVPYREELPKLGHSYAAFSNGKMPN